MKNIGKKIIICVVILIMVVPIIIEVSSKNAFKSIAPSDFDSFVSGTSNYGFGLLYVGKGDDVDSKKEINDIVKSYDGNSAKIDVSASFMDIEAMSSDDLLNIFKTTNVSTGYVFAVNGEVLRTETTKLDTKRINSYVKEYTSQGIDSDILYLKTAENAEAFGKLVKDKKTVTMAVFGRTTCSWCNLYKPVINTVAEEYNLDIYYFNSDEYDSDEYQAIMDMGLTLTAECNDGEEKNLADGFGTPLTIFTKKGKVIDCISSGYMNKSALVTKLKSVGLISE